LPMHLETPGDDSEHAEDIKVVKSILEIKGWENDR
jgi:hypothetical protein